ncbi:MAG: hypothetical protein AB8B65_11210 [Kordia sp.]|uniref:hypothetical protein n=1 Tax=Kordia sp. TaxID=1965332 RepID=UPI00385F6338
MKKVLLLFIILIYTSVSHAQKTSTDIRTAVTSHLKAMEAKNYEEALNYYYEKYYQIMSKSEFLKKLKEMDTNEMLEAKNKFSKIISVSEIITHNDVQYALVEYQVQVFFKFKNSVEEEVIQYVKAKIEAKEKNVSYSSKNKEVDYYRNSLAIVINTNGWKMLPYSKKLAPYIKSMIPSLAYEKLAIPE